MKKKLITEIGQSKFVNKEIMRKESLKLFYQNFWHYLNPIEFKIPKSDNEYIQMNILFKYNEFKSVFPKMLGEWIFSESF